MSSPSDLCCALATGKTPAKKTSDVKMARPFGFIVRVLARSVHHIEAVWDRLTGKKYVKPKALNLLVSSLAGSFSGKGEISRHLRRGLIIFCSGFPPEYNIFLAGDLRKASLASRLAHAWPVMNRGAAYSRHCVFLAICFARQDIASFAELAVFEKCCKELILLDWPQTWAIQCRFRHGITPLCTLVGNCVRINRQLFNRSLLVLRLRLSRSRRRPHRPCWSKEVFPPHYTRQRNRVIVRYYVKRECRIAAAAKWHRDAIRERVRTPVIS